MAWRREIRAPHLSPPRTRRRASLKAAKAGGQVLVGFHAEKSHRIIDMRECHILRPVLFALVAPLRTLLAQLLEAKRGAEVQLTLIDQGADVLLKGVDPQGLEAIEALTAFASRNALARLSIDQGLGPEAMYEPRPVTVTLSGTAGAVPGGGLPPGNRRRRAGAGCGGDRSFRGGGDKRRPVCGPRHLCACAAGASLRGRSVPRRGAGPQKRSPDRDGRTSRPLSPSARRF